MIEKLNIILTKVIFFGLINLLNGIDIICFTIVDQDII